MIQTTNCTVCLAPKVLCGKTIKLLILFAVISLNGFAQELTFEKSYNLLPGYHIEQTSEGGYIVSSCGQVIKLDESGEVSWKKQFSTRANCAAMAIQSWDNNFVYVTTDDNYIRLIKIDQQGNPVWEKTYDFTGTEYGLSLIEAEGKTLLLTGFITVNLKNYILLLRTDTFGNILSKTTCAYFHPSSLLQPGMSCKLIDDKIYVLTSSSLYEFNINGDSLRTLELGSNVYSFEKIEDGFLLLKGNYVSRISSQGDQIWKREFNNSQYHICKEDEKSFLIAGNQSICKMNIEGDTIWKIENTHKWNFISRTLSGNFIAVGGNSYGLRLLKLRSDGFYADLEFSQWYYSVLYAGIKQNIIISKKNVSKVNIEFSSDNGRNWNTVISGFGGSEYSWEVPYKNYDSCLIRIIDPLNSTLPVYSGKFAIRIQCNTDVISINNITMWIKNDGLSAHDFMNDGSGVFWPKNSMISSIFYDGLVWGGKINGNIYVNGSTYRTGLKPTILGKETVTRIRKLRKNWENITNEDIRKRFENEYDNWPGEYGAPYKDIDQDGYFTKGIDIPRVLGDETLWYSANDFDTIQSKWVYGSDPIGIEMHSATYAFNTNDDLADVVFKQYKLINKSDNEVTDMYLSYFSDPDLGYAEDDFVGCDTVLNLGFAYNGDNYDDNNYGLNPPAVGYKILQGPVTESPGDSALFQNKYLPDHKNLPLTAFHLYIGGNPIWVDAQLGSLKGAQEIYWQMQGKLWDGSDAINPLTHKTTKFPLSGDPVAGVGWYEGIGWPGGEAPADRRLLMSSGPFTLAPGGTQEIVVAFIAARGSGNLNSITELKKKARFVQEFYDQQILTEVKTAKAYPLKYELSQNYPNPFNPATTISYSLAEKTNVEIIVYDILGKKAAALVNEEKPAGEYRVNFNAHNLASGVYYYQLKTKKYISTRKMILLK